MVSQAHEERRVRQPGEPGADQRGRGQNVPEPGRRGEDGNRELQEDGEAEDGEAGRGVRGESSEAVPAGDGGEAEEEARRAEDAGELALRLLQDEDQNAV